MVNYNKDITLDLRNKASKCLRHYLNEMKRTRGDIKLMVSENPDSLEYIQSTSMDDPDVIRVTDLGVALEIPIVTDSFTDQTVIAKTEHKVIVCPTEDSDTPRYLEDYKALMPDFIQKLSFIETSRSNMNSEFESLKSHVEITLNRVRRNIARLVCDYGQKCTEDTFTLAFSGENVTWEGHSFYRIMVSVLDCSDFELRDVQENYVSSNDIHDNRFLFELYAKVLRMTGADRH